MPSLRTEQEGEGSSMRGVRTPLLASRITCSIMESSVGDAVARLRVSCEFYLLSQSSTTWQTSSYLNVGIPKLLQRGFPYQKTQGETGALEEPGSPSSYLPTLLISALESRLSPLNCCTFFPTVLETLPAVDGSTRPSQRRPKRK